MCATAERFFEELHRETSGIWDAISRHPFLAELVDGTLPLESFRYFVAQDYRDLEAFGLAVAMALAKAPDGPTMRRLSARVMTPIERPLHARPRPRSATSAQPRRRCFRACGPITRSASGWPSWARRATRCTPSGRRSTGMLAESTRAWRALVDEFGAEAGPPLREAMRRAFIRSSRYEYRFWNAAYRSEEWRAR